MEISAAYVTSSKRGRRVDEVLRAKCNAAEIENAPDEVNPQKSALRR